MLNVIMTSAKFPPNMVSTLINTGLNFRELFAAFLQPTLESLYKVC